MAFDRSMDQRFRSYACGCTEVVDFKSLSGTTVHPCQKHWAESIANNIDPKLVEAVRRQCGPEKPFTLGSL